MFGGKRVHHSFACVSSVVTNLVGVVTRPSTSPVPFCVCGVKGSTPMRLVSFVSIVRGATNGATVGRVVNVRPKSIMYACTSANQLRGSFNCGPSASVRRKVRGFCS